ncbi:MAG: hypothetical protein ACREOQ_14290 [Gemmatimonadales bacterium]
MVKYSELDWETIREEVSNMVDPDYRGPEQRQRIIARALQLIMERLEKGTLPELMEKCPHCDGVGVIRQGAKPGAHGWSSETSCGACRQSGRRPTEVGQAVARFVREVNAHAW